LTAEQKFYIIRTNVQSEAQSPMMEDLVKELREYILLDVEGGYYNREQIIAHAVEYLLDSSEYNPELLEETAIQLSDELLAAHFAKQKSWTYETDCDKLDEAFATLDRRGIVARQNFTCCQTCGHAEINFEIDEASKHRPIRGYVFFHEQDVERVVASGFLYLAYGSVSGKSKDSVRIGQEIVNALRNAGLQVQWNGKIEKRIAINAINWQRRRI